MNAAIANPKSIAMESLILEYKVTVSNRFDPARYQKRDSVGPQRALSHTRYSSRERHTH